jgi:hypothetical protein
VGKKAIPVKKKYYEITQMSMNFRIMNRLRYINKMKEYSYFRKTYIFIHSCDSCMSDFTCI